MTASTSAWVAVAGRSRRIDAMPISAQSLCLAPTYQCDAGVVADQHGPEARDDAALPERGHPRGQLGLDRLRVALPSRVCAVTGVMSSR